jgi:hypothetical protein
MRFTMLKISVGLLLWFSMSLSGAAPNVAFYYGAQTPWDELQAFDIVVVEPAHHAAVARPAKARSEVFAYLSVGEIEFQRPYVKALPAGLVQGANVDWKSHVIDQTHPAWAPFFVDNIVSPLWNAGYRGFFLDTLDSFHLISKTDEERTRQAQGLATTIRALRARFPQAKLIFNRGFEVLPELYREAYAVAAESLYRGWNQKDQVYTEVSEADRTWLLQQLERVRDEYKLPVIAIEYAPPGRRDLARATALKVAGHGFIPWVTTPELDQIGVGNVEITPRKVLMLHDASARDAKLYANRIQTQVRAPLNQLGYAVEYLDINGPLPAYPLAGRYAGIVSWFTDDQAVRKPGVREWLTRQREHGMRMAVLGNFPFPLNDALAGAFGLSAGQARLPQPLKVEVRDALLGTAPLPPPDFRSFTPLRANEPSAMLLRLRSNSGEIMDAAALMPWGGYVLTPYESAPALGAAGERWLIQPAEFMRRALALPPLSVTAPVGRRVERSVHLDERGHRLPSGAVAGGLTRYELEKNAIERSPIPRAS